MRPLATFWAGLDDFRQRMQGLITSLGPLLDYVQILKIQAE